MRDIALRGGAVGLAGLLTLALTGCTTRTELRSGEAPEVHFTRRWADAEITRLPRGSHWVSRHEVHGEPDLLLHDPPQMRRTAYVMRYQTTLRREQVVDYYLHRFGGRWRFDTRGRDRRFVMTANRDGIEAEIRLVGLVWPPEQRVVIPFNSDVTVIVSDRGDR